MRASIIRITPPLLSPFLPLSLSPRTLILLDGEKQSGEEQGNQQEAQGRRRIPSKSPNHNKP